MKAGNTKQRAIAEAQNLVQTRGFNGFSFQHLAEALGIKASSLYEHFTSKEDLGKRVIDEHRESFAQWTETVRVFEPKAQIGALFERFYEFAADAQKICPLSALSADLNSLPKKMRPALAKLYEVRESWLRKVIEKGQKQKEFRKDKSASDLARLVIAVGLGAQLSTRVSGEPNQIRDLKKQVLQILKA